MGLVRFLGYWVCLIGALVLLILAHYPTTLPAVLALCAIACAVGPDWPQGGWRWGPPPRG